MPDPVPALHPTLLNYILKMTNRQVYLHTVVGLRKDFNIDLDEINYLGSGTGQGEKNLFRIRPDINPDKDLGG
jgi:hypothetical protein